MTISRRSVFGAMLLTIFVVTCAGQVNDREFLNQLRLKAAFTAEDFSALDQGQRVVKLLAVTNKREVAVCGVVRLAGSPSVIANMFKRTMGQQDGKSLSASGRFSDHPDLADVETLTLENRDIEDLKSCAVGDCKLKLSAAMISRFQTEVDWNKADYRVQATRLFRQLLVEYVRDYLARGDAALIEYADQDAPIRLSREQNSLLQSLDYIHDFAPEFVEYLRAFPSEKRTDVENVVSWAKIKFGLKPVIVLTHVATYRHSTNGTSKVLIVSKQIYANHYFDSSLALSLAINFPTTAEGSNGYLLYTNHTRSDALDGSFSKLKRGLVQSTTEESLATLLEETKRNIEFKAINESQPPPVSGSRRIVEFLFGRKRLLWFLFAMILISLLIKLRPKRDVCKA